MPHKNLAQRNIFNFPILVSYTESNYINNSNQWKGILVKIYVYFHKEKESKKV